MKKVLVVAVIVIAAALGLRALLTATARVAVVKSGQAVKAVPGSVSVRAEFEVDIKSENPGRVESSELKVGQAVKKGEVLMELDPTVLQLEIEKTENDYEAAKRKIEIGTSTKVDLDVARDNLAYLEHLTETGNYPLKELERQRRGVKETERRLELEQVDAKQTLAGFENTLKMKRRALAEMKIRAPFDGLISHVGSPPGDLIGGGEPVASIISNSCVVEARISEENYSAVRSGQHATVRFLGFGDTTFPATVAQILPTADPETQRYVAILDVQIDPAKLVPGLTGEVYITVGERDAKALVPRRALVDNVVYLVQGGRVHFRKVEVGYVNLNIAEITQGLAPGDRVIVEDLDEFRDGERVRAEEIK
ncbi:MAG TPA: efflux RND transporter periplasmic adaptor subunit [Opitutus sp.]|nr:efflux RND transporter periplasmic adaptor subunit [Opitutus sp.]